MIILKCTFKTPVQSLPRNTPKAVICHLLYLSDPISFLRILAFLEHSRHAPALGALTNCYFSLDTDVCMAHILTSFPPLLKCRLFEETNLDRPV